MRPRRIVVVLPSLVEQHLLVEFREIVHVHPVHSGDAEKGLTRLGDVDERLKLSRLVLGRGPSGGGRKLERFLDSGRTLVHAAAEKTTENCGNQGLQEQFLRPVKATEFNILLPYFSGFVKAKTASKRENFAKFSKKYL